MRRKFLLLITFIWALIPAITSCSSPVSETKKEVSPIQTNQVIHNTIEDSSSTKVPITEAQKEYNYLVYPEYDEMQNTIIDKYIWVKKATNEGDKYGFINIEGNLCIPLEYDEIKYWLGASDAGISYSEGRFVVKKENKWGFVSLDGQNEDIKYEDVWYYYNELAAAKKDGKWGYINEKGIFVVDPIYEEVFCCTITYDSENKYHQPFEAEVTYVKDSEGYFFIDKSGKQISKKYDSISNEHIIRGDQTLFLVEKKQKYGLVRITDTKVEEIIIPKYDKISKFEKNLLFGFISIFTASEEFTGTKRYIIDIDNNNELPLDTNFEDFMKEYQESLEKVSNAKQTQEQEIIETMSYSTIKINAKFGLKDKYGNQVVPAIFDSIGFEKFGVVPVRVSNGKYGLISLDYVMEYYEKDIDLDGSDDKIELVLLRNNSLVIRINQKDTLVYENEGDVRKSIGNYAFYLETPHIRFIPDKRAGEQYIAVIKVYSTNKIGSTMYMKLYDAGMNELFYTDLNKPSVTTWYNSKFNISIPEYKYNKAIAITPEEIAEKASINEFGIEELKQKGPGIDLNVYRNYEFKDIDMDGYEELLLSRISYVLYPPFYFSNFTEVYKFDNGMNLIDCYFDAYN